MSTGSDWLDQAKRLLDVFVQGQAASAGSAEGAGSGTTAQHAADCAWCPLCQAAAVVRGDRPEVSAALADLLTTSANALRAFAESVEPAGRTAPAGTDDTPVPEPPPAVQRIEIA
jgi:hypothetical protein